MKAIPILIILSLILIVACSTVDKRDRTVYQQNIQADRTILTDQEYPVHALRVVTLNLAHGRRDSLNQLLVNNDTFRHNLDSIVAVLDRTKPHVIALQEADAASRWSGNFDHVSYLAVTAGYPWRVHAINAKNWLFSFGTALLSALPLVDTIEHTFESSPPTLDKGFVLAQIQWPFDDGAESRSVDLISVHLDFSRQMVREQQINELQSVLQARMNPTIIMGDFNSEWLKEASTIRALAEESRFTTYQPESTGYETYKGKRLDWILITKDLEFVDYRVLPDTLSDHAMLVADIRFRASTDDANPL